MPTTYAAAEAERVRLHGKSVVAIVTPHPTETWGVFVKDSRCEPQNQPFIATGVTPSTWVKYTVAQSQALFT